MESQKVKVSIALLIMRLSLGSFMLIGHGWAKFLGFAQIAPGFPDPLGVGPALSLGLVVFAEVFCAAILALGLFTRLATIPLIVTMFMAFFVIHGADPFAKKEMAALYLSGYLALFIAGPGDFSLQRFLKISANSRLVPINWLLK